MAVLGGALAMIAWEALVALIARRRPVPLILYVIGLIAVGAVAAMLLVGRATTTSELAIGSLATGFLAAIGFVIIWQVAPSQTPAATRTAVRIGRTLIVRGIAFSAIVLLLSFVIRLLRASG